MLTEPMEKFSFKSSINLAFDSKWMTVLTSLEVENSIFKISAENNQFEQNTENFDKFSFREIKDELAEILGLSDISPKLLQHEIRGLRNIKAYKKLLSD